MTDIARLPFHHAEGEGVLVLSDDGTVRVEASEALRDALAAREEQALSLARTYGTRLGLGLICFGLAAVAAGWYVGRIYGKHAWRQIAARSIQNVEITLEGDGQLRARLGKAVWKVSGFDPKEAELFFATFQEMKDKS